MAEKKKDKKTEEDYKRKKEADAFRPPIKMVLSLFKIL